MKLTTGKLVPLALALVLLIVGLTVWAVYPTTKRSGAPTARASKPPEVFSPSVSAALLERITDQVATPGDPATSAVWPTLAPTCYRCNSALGVAAATVARLKGDPTELLRARETFNQLIAQHQTPSGAFDGDGAAHSTPDEINSMFVTTELGTAFLLIGDRIPAATKAAWVKALIGGVDYLNTPNQRVYYVNGNIQVGRALSFALAWKVTGRDDYRRDYLRELNFAQHPTKPGWDGWGLILTKQPTQADGSDGAGYFTEAGSDRKPGYDPDYVQLQSDQLARLYMVTGDPQVLRLLNLLTNQLLTRLDASNLHLNTGNGTRHVDANQWRYYFAAAPSVLESTGRTGFADILRKQFAAEKTYYPMAATLAQPGNVYAIGNGVVTAALVESKINLG